MTVNLRHMSMIHYLQGHFYAITFCRFFSVPCCIDSCLNLEINRISPLPPFGSWIILMYHYWFVCLVHALPFLWWMKAGCMALVVLISHKNLGWKRGKLVQSDPEVSLAGWGWDPDSPKSNVLTTALHCPCLSLSSLILSEYATWVTRFCFAILFSAPSVPLQCHYVLGCSL